MTGGCQCGRVRYAVEVADDDAYLCHCRMCQKATGGVAAAFKSVERGKLRWIAEPDWYESSPIARRPFCAACGTPLGYASNYNKQNFDLTVGSFDDPSALKPVSHFGAEGMHRAWLDTTGLPEKRTEDYQPVVDRWVDATGKFPG